VLVPSHAGPRIPRPARRVVSCFPLGRLRGGWLVSLRGLPRDEERNAVRARAVVDRGQWDLRARHRGDSDSARVEGDLCTCPRPRNTGAVLRIRRSELSCPYVRLFRGRNRPLAFVVFVGFYTVPCSSTLTKESCKNCSIQILSLVSIISLLSVF
jgi:hypothetical protein